MTILPHIKFVQVSGALVEIKNGRLYDCINKFYLSYNNTNYLVMPSSCFFVPKLTVTSDIEIVYFDKDILYPMFDMLVPSDKFLTQCGNSIYRNPRQLGVGLYSFLLCNRL